MAIDGVLRAVARLLRGLPILLLLLAAAAAQAQRKPYDTGPPPAWVEVHQPASAATAAAGQLAQDVHYLLVDHQVRVEGRDRVSYRHLASKAVNSQGVQSVSNIEIRFDPSYQRLTLHSVGLRRGAQVIPQLGAATVRLLQRETELDALIFDGSVTASIVLDDVRVGDVVEYAFSLRGQNPVFGGRQFGRFDLQWNTPVARVYARLLWPAGRELHHRLLNHAPAAAVSDSAGDRGYRDYRWDRSDVGALQVEKDAPSWFDPYAAVQWSDFGDWQAVAAWAEPLYRLPERPAARVQAVATKIAAEHAALADRLRAALTFVQREVRYLGVEIGAGSHAPSAPQTVLERRFGDCKDKTLLTVALLRALGIEAQPALVNTGMRQAIAGWQPSPGAFNHVLVKARVGGEDWWLDPTRPPQAGAADRLVQADFGQALVISPQPTALQPMAGDKALRMQRQVHAVLDSQAGVEQPVPYTVTTRLEGRSADAMRATLASTSLDRLQKQYQNFYASYYPGIEVAAPLQVQDDEVGNTLSITEHYTVKDFWRRPEGKRRRVAQIEVPDLAEHLRAPHSMVREAPLALAHPVDLRHVTEVRLPSRWTIKPDQLHIEDPAFEFERTDKVEGQTLWLTDSYRSRQEHVEAADVGRYAAQLEKARKSIGYQLFFTPPLDAAAARSGGPHWLPATAAALGLVALAVLGLRLLRWDPTPWPAATPGQPGTPSGLGGWLVLAGIVIAVAGWRTGSSLINNLPVYSAERWLALTTPGEPEYHALWLPLLLFELLGLLTLVAGYLVTVMLFLRRRSSLPRVYVATLLATLLFNVVDTALTQFLPVTEATSTGWLTELLRSLLGTAIWVAYFSRSLRVRNTFVERRAVSGGAGAGAADAADPATIAR